VALAVLGAAGCRQDMHDAPRYDPLEASPVFLKGSSAQPLVEGTIARGTLREDTLLTTGKIGADLSNVFPFAITRADLDRGEERFNVYCAPCHGRTGEGNGMVVQRGYRQPPSYHIDRLQKAPAGYVFDTITNGFGVMPDYRAQLGVEDRWRVVAYVRALQLSRMATTADVPATALGGLTAAAGSAPPAAGSGAPAAAGAAKAGEKGKQ
jgi:cytochrome c553